MMKLTYDVHSFQKVPVMVTVTYQDREMQAPIDCMVAEMTSQDGSHTITLRTVPGDMGEAEAMFVPGAKVAVEFSAG